MNVNSKTASYPKFADSWNLPKGDHEIVIAVIGSEQDIFFAQSLAEGLNDRPIRQQDLMKIRFFGGEGN